jgi:hypothetical protein
MAATLTIHQVEGTDGIFVLSGFWFVEADDQFDRLMPIVAGIEQVSSRRDFYLKSKAYF